MKFGQNIDVNKVELEGQGYQVKKCYFRSNLTILQVIFDVKGPMGHGQRSHGSRSKVDHEGQGHQVKNVISGFIWPSYK